LWCHQRTGYARYRALAALYSELAARTLPPASPAEKARQGLPPAADAVVLAPSEPAPTASPATAEATP
jgi:hypothetical protein